MKVLLIVVSVLTGDVLTWVSKSNRKSTKIFMRNFQGGYKINFDYNDLKYDENLLNMDMQVKRNGDKTVVNVRAEQFVDIEDPIVIHVSHYEKVNKEFQHLVNSSVNVCNVMSRFKSHPIVRIILKELLKSSNMPTSCPIKKVFNC